MPIEVFTELIRNHAAAIRDSEKVDDVERIYLPGQIEAEREALASVDGIELDPPVQAALEKLIESKGLDLSLNGDGVS